MDLGLKGVVALVVGGTGLIGRATAQILYAEGATVVLGARHADALAEAAAAIGPEVGTVVIDTSDQTSVDAAIDHVVSTYGGIGALVNTAAPSASTFDPARSADPDQVADAIAGKALGYLRVTNAVLPHMVAAGYGRIVQVSGQNVLLTGSVVAASRNAAVTIAAKTLADQVAGSGVAINVVDPGPVRESAASEVAPGSPGESTPHDVATVVVLLASPAVAAVSGESVSVGHKVRGIVGY